MNAHQVCRSQDKKQQRAAHIEPPSAVAFYLPAVIAARASVTVAHWHGLPVMCGMASRHLLLLDGRCRTAYGADVIRKGVRRAVFGNLVARVLADIVPIQASASFVDTAPWLSGAGGRSERSPPPQSVVISPKQAAPTALSTAHRFLSTRSRGRWWLPAPPDSTMPKRGYPAMFSCQGAGRPRFRGCAGERG